jgi:hypothetical protein
MSKLLEILLIGHSLVGHTLPDMLQHALHETPGEGRVAVHVINGAPLGWNWEHSADAEGVDARAVLPSGDFGTVVMTEALPLVNHTTWSDSHGHAALFYELAVQSNPEAQVFLYETWHSLDSGTGVAVEYDDNDHIAWRDRLDQDLALWQGIVDHVNKVRAPGGAPMRLLPAGQAMGLMHDEIARGAVPGIDDIRDLFHDAIHPNDLGWYYVAMVHYAAITGQSPEGLAPRFTTAGIDASPAELAGVMQRLAWESVAGFEQAQAPAPQPRHQATAEAATTDAAPGPAGTTETERASAAPLAQTVPAETGGPAIGFNLAPVSDWSTQQPFLDVMKSARAWTGHLPGQWGGWNHDDLARGGWLDEDGWPLALPDELDSIGTILFADLPPEAVSTEGNYRLTHAGAGRLELRGRVRNLGQRPGEIRFHYAPGPGILELHIRETDPDGTGDHVRDIRVVKEEHLERQAAGALFNPLWLERLGRPTVLRMMDWMATNNSELAAWADRPRVSHYTWSRKGVPVEVMIALANEIGADPWFTLPHLADDDFVRRFAGAVRDGLEPGLRAHVEYSNEVWNWGFAQSHWAEAQGQERWGEDGTWTQYHGMRAAQVAGIWNEVFGGQAADRLVNVIGVQTDWIGLERAILHAPLWVAENPQDITPPFGHFDAYGVTGYFSGRLGSDDKAPKVLDWIAESRAWATAEAEALGLEGAAREAHVAVHRFDLATDMAAMELRDGALTGDATYSLAHMLGEVLPHHAAVAREHGLELVMYEGGTHVVGDGERVHDEALTKFFHHINYSPQMSYLYDEFMDGWRALGGGVFNAYVDVLAPTRWGSWGHLRHLDDDNPRWQTLLRRDPALGR